MTNNTHIPYRNNKGDLTKGPVRKHLMRLSGPMTWGIMMIISFQLVDTYYVSLLGTEALAALTFTFPVTFWIFSFIMGFGIAMSSVVSRLIGEGEEDSVKRVTTHGLILVFAIGVGLSLIGFALMDPIFRTMGATEEMMPMIHDYMEIWFAGAVFVSMPLVGNAAIRATGDTFVPAMIMTIVAVLNVILDPLLIFGLLGFPRLELQGAAIATVFANAIAMMAGLYVIAYRKHMICQRSAMRFDLFKNSAARLLFIAIPAGLTNSIQPVVNAIIIGLLAAYGSSVVAAYGIVTRVEAFAFVILMGVAVGMGPIIGQNWGAKNFVRVNETLRLAMGFNVFWSLGVAVCLGLLARPIAGLFSDEASVIAYAALFFWIVPFSYAFSNLVNGWASAFNAMGMPQRSLLMIVLKMLILMIPAVYAGNALGGVTGIFIAIAAVNAIAGTIFHIWSWRTCIKWESALGTE